MSNCSKQKHYLRISALATILCLCISLFANVLPAGAADDIPVWSGSEGAYAGLDLDEVIGKLGEQDGDGYYHIKTAEQLHAVIRNNGGGKKFRLDNDLYLNENYKDYQKWGVDDSQTKHPNKPANIWDFSGKTGGGRADPPTHNFYGEIDGCGHTIYGLCCIPTSGDGFYNGLIGGLGGGKGKDTTISNLNIWYSYVRGGYFSGFVIGGQRNGWDGNTKLNGVSVRYGLMDRIYNKGSAGGMIGLTCQYTTIENCSVTDVEFISCGETGDTNSYSSIGSFIGTVDNNSNRSQYPTYHNGQARDADISNSFAVNNKTLSIHDAAVNKKPYIVGVFDYDGTTYLGSYCATANNVYTDSTEISETSDGRIKLLVSRDQVNPIEPDSPDYPVKTVSAEDVTGRKAKFAMPALDWCVWNPVSGDYPTPLGSHSLIPHPQVPATCTQEGVEAYWECGECKRLFSDENGKYEIDAPIAIEAINHKRAEHVTPSDATCTVDGNCEHWFCPDCGKYSRDPNFENLCDKSDVVIPALNHPYKQKFPAAAATCEEDGHNDYWYCPDCDKYFNDEVCEDETTKDGVVTEKRKGHSKSPEFHEATSGDGTCINPGTVAYYECPDCGQYFRDSGCTEKLDSIDAPSDKHQLTAVSRKDPTCYESGVDAHYKCDICGKLFYDSAAVDPAVLADLTLPAIEHKNAEYVPALPAGCTSSGANAHYHCPDCGGYFETEGCPEDSRVEYSALLTPALGHTAPADGVYEYNSESHYKTCTVCGAVLETAAHSLSAAVAVEDGSVRSCICGYSVKAFAVDSDGAKISSDYGVFDPDITLHVEYIRTEQDRLSILSNMSDSAAAAEVYRVSALEGLLAVMPNGRYTLSLPVPKSYSGNVAVYFCDLDGNVSRVSANVDRSAGTATVSENRLGSFIIADLGVSSGGSTGSTGSTGNTGSSGYSGSAADNSETESPKTGDNSAILIFLSTALAAGSMIVLNGFCVRPAPRRKDLENK